MLFQVKLLHRRDDKTLARLCGAEEREVSKVRVAFGWESRVAKEGEEVEGLELEFNCIMYNTQASS